MHAYSLKEDTLTLLEFDRIIERLSSYTSFIIGKELSQKIQPLYTESEINESLQETEEAVLITEVSPSLTFTGSIDLRQPVNLARLGGILLGQDLASISQTLSIFRDVRASILKHKTQSTLLATKVSGIPTFQMIQKEINRCVGANGDLLDSSSEELAKYRSQARIAYYELQQALLAIIDSEDGQVAVQEPIITTRSERLVLMIKTEFRNRIPGLVHDISESGATVFLEPLSTVGLGNAWMEYRLSENREAHRILRDLSKIVSNQSHELLNAIRIMGEIDMSIAKAHLAKSMSAIKPNLGKSSNGITLRLVQARHPLLREPVIPLDLEVQEHIRVLVVTGPNTGGKTVALKTVGLLSLMAQAGLYIPAQEGTVLTVFDGIYASIGDQQSIEGSLSTFSSNVTKIGEILRQVSNKSLVLLDELVSSTSPEEGSALGKAILGHINKIGAVTICTTHHTDIAALAQSTPGMRNARMEIEPDTLRPTYKMLTGIPGRSYGLAIASSLGISNEIIQHAHELLGSSRLALEELMENLKEQQLDLEHQLAEATSHLIEAEEFKQQYQDHLQSFIEEKEDLKAQALDELQQRIKEVESLLKSAIKASKRHAHPKHGPNENISGIDHPQRLHDNESLVGLIKTARQQIQSSYWPSQANARNPEQAIKPGMIIHIKNISVPGKVLSPPDLKGVIEVEIGGLRARIPSHRILGADSASPSRKTKISLSRVSRHRDNKNTIDSPSSEIILKGLHIEQALEQLERFLDNAVLDKLRIVRIVHGKGTGQLRNAVRVCLAEHPMVNSFSLGEQSQGGDGVTIALLG